MEIKQINSKTNTDVYSDASDVELEFTEPKQNIKLKIKTKDIIKKRQENPKIKRVLNTNDTTDYTCLFMGIRLAENSFTNENRRTASVFETLSNNTDYSSSCFRNSEFKSKYDLGRYISGKMSEEEVNKLQEKENLTKNFIDFLYKKTDLKTKVNSRYFYESLLLVLLNINTNIYSEMDLFIKELREYLISKKDNFNISEAEIKIVTNAFVEFANEPAFDRKMFISTSMREEIGVQYVLPYISNEQIMGFNPNYNKDGKPQHRH